MRIIADLQIAIERCRGILLIASEESLSRGWVKAEYNSAMDERANDDGFRVVALRLGDARDQKGFAANERVERIIKSCGAFVGIIPSQNHQRRAIKPISGL